MTTTAKTIILADHNRVRLVVQAQHPVQRRVNGTRDVAAVCVHLDGDVDSTLRATMVASELRDEAGLRAMLAAVGMMFAGFANGADVDTFPNEQLEGA